MYSHVLDTPASCATIPKSILADGVIKSDELYVASIVKYRSIIALMQDFFSDMWAKNNKDMKLRHAEPRLLLKETGFLPGVGNNR
ncbi:MAG: hypothetical protein V7K79_26995 [Nostoc sp.]